MARTSFEGHHMITRYLLAVAVFATPLNSVALQVFACEPEWAALTRELAGSDVEITVATTAFQDPHQLQAKPSLIAAARNADLVVCSGADLEIGWLPLLLRRAGNPAIQPGNPAHFLAADYVRRIEMPSSVDRSAGDVHPQGNPHVHLHPRNIERIAKALADRLVELDAGQADEVQRRLADFLARWSNATAAWEEQAEPLKGMQLVSHHRSFSYLAEWLELDVVATLEPKPGVPASGAQLAKLLQQLQDSAPAAIIRTPFENEKPARWLSERLDVSVLQLPYTIGGSADATDLFSLYDVTLRMLEEKHELN
jgi:zinc/manganese transport system substrate-binding protein